MIKSFYLAVLALLVYSFPVCAQDLSAAIDSKATALQPKLTEWRRHIHQNPELGNREFKTVVCKRS